jgi:nucleotide-binding universal stress UspA family protein
MQSQRTVIWAIDPWDRSGSPALVEVRRLARAARRSGLKLLPVHVASFPKALWENGGVPPLPAIQEELEKSLARYSVPHSDPLVVVDESGTRAGAVRQLLRVACEQNAEWVLVSSHGHGGASRLMFGSFVELLLSHCALPLFFLPRESLRPATRSSRVALFPTDLSSAAHVAFTRFLAVAASQHLEIAILHGLSLPVGAIDPGLGPVAISLPLPHEELEWRELARVACEALVEEARRHGVKARFALDSGVAAITGDSVLAAARREKARVIAMPSMSGPWTRLVAGSVAQKVFRSGRVSVCVYGPEALSA